MKYDWMDDYILEKKGVTKDFKLEWNAYRYLVGKKMMGMHCGDKYDKSIITLKCDPDFGILLRETYKDITAGYYMNKVHWNSLYLDGDVPDEILKQMIDNSYDLIFASLTKKLQKEILG
jgi:predicted DNA-binding protein (MmcQ/YjbR family)